MTKSEAFRLDVFHYLSDQFPGEIRLPDSNDQFDDAWLRYVDERLVIHIMVAKPPIGGCIPVEESYHLPAQEDGEKTQIFVDILNPQLDLPRSLADLIRDLLAKY